MAELGWFNAPLIVSVVLSIWTAVAIAIVYDYVREMRSRVCNRPRSIGRADIPLKRYSSVVSRRKPDSLSGGRAPCAKAICEEFAGEHRRAPMQSESAYGGSRAPMGILRCLYRPIAK